MVSVSSKVAPAYTQPLLLTIRMVNIGPIVAFFDTLASFLTTK
jgi:hypothetical protein